MLEPERAKPGLPVTVRNRPLIVNGREFASRPYRGIIAALDPKGRGAYVSHPKGGQRFATWEEMSPRRLKEGEDEE
jgi:hypothetical protein